MNRFRFAGTAVLLLLTVCGLFCLRDNIGSRENAGKISADGNDALTTLLPISADNIPTAAPQAAEKQELDNTIKNTIEPTRSSVAYEDIGVIGKVLFDGKAAQLDENIYLLENGGIRITDIEALSYGTKSDKVLIPNGVIRICLVTTEYLYYAVDDGMCRYSFAQGGISLVTDIVPDCDIVISNGRMYFSGGNSEAVRNSVYSMTTYGGAVRKLHSASRLLCVTDSMAYIIDNSRRLRSINCNTGTIIADYDTAFSVNISDGVLWYTDFEHTMLYSIDIESGHSRLRCNTVDKGIISVDCIQSVDNYLYFSLSNGASTDTVRIPLDTGNTIANAERVVSDGAFIGIAYGGALMSVRADSNSISQSIVIAKDGTKTELAKGVYIINPTDVYLNNEGLLILAATETEPGCFGFQLVYFKI